MRKFLVETCLLTHGLRSVTNAELEKALPKDLSNIVWIEEGQIKIGGAEEYLPFRAKECGRRINMKTLDEALSNGWSGALTASGTMAVCANEGIPLAVSCGISGMHSYNERPPLDFAALKELPVTLLCTSFKDMYDIPGSLKWLSDNGVRTAGLNSRSCTGYVFNSAEAPLKYVCSELSDPDKADLILNPIPASKRIGDISILNKAVVSGNEAAKCGRAFHPAVNAYLDEATDGLSSRLQLESIIENIKIAVTL